MEEVNDAAEAPVDFVLVQTLLQMLLIRIHCDPSHESIVLVEAQS